MPILNMIDEMAIVEKRLNNNEEMLGKGLMQPFSNTNSGSRKIMFNTHLEQRLPLLHPEVPLIQTGYENEFGERSSSFITSDASYKVACKIPKFSFNPAHHFFMILDDEENNTLGVIERVSYKHITETYGYLFNNDRLDSMAIGDTICKGEVIQKSQSFDDFNNRMDGVNLVTAYLSCEHTMEDGSILSKSAAKKLSSPLFKPVSVLINDNDIPLNLYGNDSVYKIFPDIGENITNSLLCAIRREKKEESLYTQSYNRLKDILMSDDKYPVEGRVIDIDIYCNNPAGLDSSFYNDQLKKYYNENIRMNTEIIEAIEPYVAKGYKLSYDLQKIFYNAKRILNGDQYINDRPFSNIIINLTVLEENEIEVGDKLSDRYGGKGVVSIIVDDDMMPLLDDGYTHVEYINNQNTCVNRENAGQLFEVSLNHISKRIVEFINLNILDISESIEMLTKYFNLISPELSDYFVNTIESIKDDQDVILFLSSFTKDEGIILPIKPMSESMTIDKLNDIYKEFPWAVPNNIVVPIKDSNDNIRYVNSRRPIIAACKYVYRLKQYAEEKFSATSLSSTNIKNENSRNKSNRSFKSRYTRTPIKFGEMETGDLGHLGMEAAIINLMIHSTSPHGRRLAEQLLTGDPFNIDIKLDLGAKNRSVEIVQSYLKTMGLRLVFIKKEKKIIKPCIITPADFYNADDSGIIPAIIVDNKNGEVINDAMMEKYMSYMARKIIVPGTITPAIFLMPEKE